MGGDDEKKSLGAQKAAVAGLYEPTPGQKRFVERYNWQKVHAPKAWKPRIVGEELVGFYGGRTLRNGKFGQYEVVLVHVPYRGTFMATGTELIQLLDSGLVCKGAPIRIIWRGLEDIGPDPDTKEPRNKKRFELLVAEGDPIAEDELPEITVEHQ